MDIIYRDTIKQIIKIKKKKACSELSKTLVNLVVFATLNNGFSIFEVYVMDMYPMLIIENAEPYQNT